MPKHDTRYDTGYSAEQDISNAEYQRQMRLLFSTDNNFELTNNIEDFFQHLNFDNLPNKGTKQPRLESNKNVDFLSNKRQKFA